MNRKKLCLLICGLTQSAAFANSPVTTWSEPSTGMIFVSIPKGCYQMGTKVDVDPPANTMWDDVHYKRTLSDNEKPAHETCVDAVWIGKFEVRRKEWRALMGPAPNASSQNDDDNLPVSHVRWDEAQLFAKRLTERSGGKYRFRLPTEAEWEYACLAGTSNDNRPAPQELARVAHFGLRSPDPDRGRRALDPVGQRQPNAFGLHDMLGNVWEWVEDHYAANAYARHDLYNPRITEGTDLRVIRGASFRTEFDQVRCARRGRQAAAEALDTIGFRLVREP